MTKKKTVIMTVINGSVDDVDNLWKLLHDTMKDSDYEGIVRSLDIREVSEADLLFAIKGTSRAELRDQIMNHWKKHD